MINPVKWLINTGPKKRLSSALEYNPFPIFLLVLPWDMVPGLDVVQIMLGHSTIFTTLDIYSHVDIELQEEAVNKLDEAINLDM